jgi:hypothetical protein
MADLKVFNLPQTPPADGGSDFVPVPPGAYQVVMVESSVGKTNDGYDCLNYTLEVVEGPYKGRKIWDKFLLDHPKPITVEIAQRRLYSLCRILGVPYPPNDSSQFHNQPVVAVVKHSTPIGSTKVFANVDRFQPVSRLGGQPVTGQGGQAVSRARLHENPVSRRGAYPHPGSMRQPFPANPIHPQQPAVEGGNGN